MNRAALEESWTVTRSLLAAAKDALPSAPAAGAEGATLADYEHFLNHNELELALDELADIGLTNSPPPHFWTGLARAAENMGLLQRAQELRGVVTGKHEA